MAAAAEAGAELAVRKRIAQQELLGAAAVLVEIVERAVLHLEAIEVARVAAEGRRDVEELGIRRRSRRCRRAGRRRLRCGRTGFRRDWKSTSEARSLTSLLGHAFRHAVGIGGAVDAVIDRRQIAAHRRRRPVLVEGGQAVPDWAPARPPARTGRGRRARSTRDASAGHRRWCARPWRRRPVTSSPTRSTVPAFSAGAFKQLGDRLGHAGGVVADIARVLEGLGDLAVGVEGDDVFGEDHRLLVDGGARRHADVLGNDPARRRRRSAPGSPACRRIAPARYSGVPRPGRRRR